MSNNKYAMVADIIEAEKITDTIIKDALRRSYFRGLAHSDNKDKILNREVDSAIARGEVHIPQPDNKTHRASE